MTGYGASVGNSRGSEHAHGLAARLERIIERPG